MKTFSSQAISSHFLMRRVHSLLGVWLVVYLFEHLIVNSQAALWLGDDGIGFVRLVNLLESLPFLHALEWILIGVPLLIHGGWGIQRAWMARTNDRGGGGKKPHLPYSRNRAFTWQRLSSWILLIGIFAHVLQMRVLGYPVEAIRQDERLYLNKIPLDESLFPLAPRVGVTLYTFADVEAMIGEEDSSSWKKSLQALKMTPEEMLVVGHQPGQSMLFMVREHFQSLWLCILYTLFVLAAVFHASNGLWTSLITWGAVLSFRGQQRMLPVSGLLSLLLAFLGLCAIWGSYAN